jgi:hypothetical protein
MKTGGTGLVLRLAGVYGEQAVYPSQQDWDAREEATSSLPQLLAQWNQRRFEIRVVTGHFPFCTMELLGVEFTSLTTLRDPVDRTLSYLRHHRKVNNIDPTTSLEEIYDDPFAFQLSIKNHMVKLCSMTVDEALPKGVLAPVFDSDARLERAKRNLEQIDLIGLQERLEDFWLEAEHRFGWNLGPLGRANASEPEPASNYLRRRIAADNFMDVELYEFAVELCEARRRACV